MKTMKHWNIWLDVTAQPPLYSNCNNSICEKHLTGQNLPDMEVLYIYIPVGSSLSLTPQEEALLGWCFWEKMVTSQKLRQKLCLYSTEVMSVENKLEFPSFSAHLPQKCPEWQSGGWWSRSFQESFLRYHQQSLKGKQGFHNQMYCDYHKHLRVQTGRLMVGIKDPILCKIHFSSVFKQ